MPDDYCDDGVLVAAFGLATNERSDGCSIVTRPRCTAVSIESTIDRVSNADHRRPHKPKRGPTPLGIGHLGAGRETV